MIRKLMQNNIHKGLIVLAEKEKGIIFSGTVVQSEGVTSWKIGHYSSGWVTHAFHPYKGDPIQLPPAEKIDWHENGWVKDDNDIYWFFNGHKLVCTGDDSESGGIFCLNLRDGIAWLQENGYIDEDKVL